MTRKAPRDVRKKIGATIGREAVGDMPMRHSNILTVHEKVISARIYQPLDKAVQHRSEVSSVFTNAYALALGILCGRYPSTATLAFTVTGMTGMIMLLLKAYSNEYAPTTKTKSAATSGLTEEGSFRTALQLLPIIGSLAIISALVPWRFSILVVGFIIPVWLFVEHEIHQALNVDSYLKELRQAWKCARGKKCVPDECLKGMKSHEPKIELLTWMVFAWLMSVVWQSPSWLQLLKSALRHGS